MADEAKKLLDKIVGLTNNVVNPTKPIDVVKYEDTKVEITTSTIEKLPTLEELLGKRS